MVEFRDLVGVAIAPVSKQLAVKYSVNGKLRHEKIGFWTLCRDGWKVF